MVTPRHCLVVLGFALALGLALPAQADRAAEKRRQLRELRDRIEAVRQELAAKRAQRDRASQKLAEIEQRIGEIAGKLARIDERMRATKQRISELERRRREVKTQLAAHRNTLAQQLRAAYRLGRQPALRLLLRQDDPGTIARALGYYSYLNDARLVAIERARELVAELEQIANKTRKAKARLADDRARLAQQRQSLQAARSEREQLITQLDASIDDQGERLRRLKESRERLEDLLQRLESALGDIPAAPLEQQPFASRKGTLEWPVDGRVRQRFGSVRAGGRMRWQGVVISANPGRQVKAVYYGRVVFADWLSGFGQLIIVNHLDGYMSLYGYNRRLLRTVGDWVVPGDPVATVGSSGGRRKAGLYFEIRRNGQPIEPTAWLAQR